MRFLRQIASKFYPYRWHLSIFGIAFIVLLSKLLNKGEPLEEGTLRHALFITGASIGIISGAVSALAFQLDPRRGGLRTEKDDGWFTKTYNESMRTIVAVTMIGLVFLCTWFTAAAWFSVFR